MVSVKYIALINFRFQWAEFGYAIALTSLKIRAAFYPILPLFLERGLLVSLGSVDTGLIKSEISTV